MYVHVRVMKYATVKPGNKSTNIDIMYNMYMYNMYIFGSVSAVISDKSVFGYFCC